MRRHRSDCVVCFVSGMVGSASSSGDSAMSSRQLPAGRQQDHLEVRDLVSLVIVTLSRVLRTSMKFADPNDLVVNAGT